MINKPKWKYFSDNYLLLFFIFFILTLVIYLPAKDARFISDYAVWTRSYAEKGIYGLVNSFGDASLKYTYHFLMFSLYKMLGWHTWLWHLFFSFFHSLNALLICSFVRKLNGYFPNAADRSGFASVCAALFFLLSPYQVEVVAWAAAIHFLMITFFSLLSFILLLKYLSDYKPVHLLFIHLLFITGLFATEAILILPVIMLFIVVLVKDNHNIKWLYYIPGVLVPQLICIAGFFLLTKFVYGKAIGHYGAETHLNLDAGLLGSNFFKYLLKFLTFFRYYPFNTQAILKFIERPAFGISIVFIGMVIFITICLRWKKVKTCRKEIWLFLFLFAVSLLPVINLTNTFLVTAEADRYGYFPSVFIYIGLAYVCLILPEKIRTKIAIGYLLVSFACLGGNIYTWYQNANMIKQLVRVFPYSYQGNIYLLSVSDNYKGVYSLRQGLPELLNKEYGNKNKAHIKIVGVMGMQSIRDSVKVTQKSPHIFSVEVGSWGNWFNFRAQGEGTDYNLKVNEGSFQFDIEFLNQNDTSLILYQSGDRWVKVNKQ